MKKAAEGNFLSVLIFSIIASFAAMLIQLAISRSREYLADEGGAHLTIRCPRKALGKLDNGRQKIPMDANPSTAHMFIVIRCGEEASLFGSAHTRPLKNGLPGSKNGEDRDVLRKSTPRAICLEILNRIDETGRPADRLLTDSFKRYRHLTSLDQAFLTELTYGTLRWRGKLDWTIRHFSNIPFEKVESKVLNVLRVGFYQILFMSRTPSLRRQ